MEITLIEVMQALKIAGGTLFVISAAIVVWAGIYFLAKNDLLITFCPEGQLKAIMRGDSLHRFIASVKNWYYDEETDTMVSLERRRPVVGGEGEEVYYDPDPTKNFINNWLGIYWVGLPPFYRVNRYQFRWNKRKTGEPKTSEAGGYGMEGKDEEVGSLFFQFPYVLKILWAETSERIPVDVYLLITTRTVHPEMTLFKTHDWLSHLTGYIEAIVRDWVGNIDIAGLTQAKNETGGEQHGFVKSIMAVNEDPSDTAPSANRGLRNLIGQEVIVANFLGFDLSGDAGDKVREATTRAYVARQDADAVSTLAVAEEDRVTRRYAAIEKYPHGAQIAMAEAIERTRLSVLSVGGQGIVPAVNIPVRQDTQDAPTGTHIPPKEKK